MTRKAIYIAQSIILLLITIFVWEGFADVFTDSRHHTPKISFLTQDSIASDTIVLPYKFHDQEDLHYRDNIKSPLFMRDPKNMETEVSYDPSSHEYIFVNKVGTIETGRPYSLSFKEYQQLEMENSLRNYWLDRQKTSNIRNQDREFKTQFKIGGETFEQIFGSNSIDIRPRGSVKIDFSIVSNKRNDPSIDVRRQRTTYFKFDEQIAMNVMAKIGDKIEFNVNYNTEATFDFERQSLKLKYEGKEDEIVKLIEAGNVNLPLNSSLINGSQSLFGVKTQLQFGKTTVTTVLTQQQGEARRISVEGGAKTNRFQIKADDYDENRHFFLNHYFRGNYEDALAELPIISSNVEIIKVEVWRTTIGPAKENNRNIIAFSDLGETSRYNNKNISPVAGKIYPSNNANTLLYDIDTIQLRDIYNISDYLEMHNLHLVSGRDYEKIENATKIDPSQYTINSRLGFISINSPLNPNQALAISYQYKIIGQEEIYQVGEFSDEGINSPQTLVVKLIRSTSVDTRIPMWDLMMKNIYSIQAYQISSENFMLNILYSGGENGVPTGYFNEGSENVKGVPLIRLMNLDNLNQQNNPPGDGVFDFIDNAATQGGTIQSNNGKIFFPVLEPFGSHLRKKLETQELGDKYAFDSLYTLTKSGVLQYPSKNKFILEGMYKSSSGSEISLNAHNVPRGSVKVTAGGQQLTENVDFTVDYTLGSVRIINEGVLNSGTPINIALESNSTFNLQQKRMVGTHINYQIDRNFNIGGTIMNLHERPITNKVSYGNDPISNTIWGLNLDYETNSPFITRMIDKLPFISTKHESKIQFNGEFAQFIPSHAKVIGKEGTSYIADFENSKYTIDLKQPSNWFIASTPQGQTERGMFPEGAAGTGLVYGFNRAAISWYIIAPLFYDRRGSYLPKNIDLNEISSHYTRAVNKTELFPNLDLENDVNYQLSMLDISYFPSEKGPYNYDSYPKQGFSSGIDKDGLLLDPESRWGGIMRKIESSNFEDNNVEYIEFWLMDPFVDPDGDGPRSPMNTNGGKLYFNLGDISEDILRDRRKSFEHGLPTSENVINVDTTIWGRVPSIHPIVNEFDSDPASRKYQDVGYDGLGNADEVTFFAPYLQEIAELYGTNSPAYLNAIQDPSNDDYHHYRGSDYDNDPMYTSIVERYKRFNGVEGNSATDDMSNEAFPTLSSRRPNVEDINQDNTLNESERYYQYVVELHPNRMEVGSNYIADKYTTPPMKLPNGERGSVTWYQFKIPVRSPEKVVGNIHDFRSIRFMRMFLKEFQEPVILRFGTLDLVRSDWRRFDKAILDDGEYIVTEDKSAFDLSSVSIEENGKRYPIPYALPPGIEREQLVGTTKISMQNEQSMVLKVCDLADGYARAAYKPTNFDFRQYNTLKMFVHAEKSNFEDHYNTGDLTLFLRIGSDFHENYYEYEVPLSFTDWGAANPRDIWPESNEINLPLDKLADVKLKRQKLQNEGNTHILNTMPFQVKDGKNTITLKGVPNISDVKTIMIGVRNPKKRGFNDSDDGLDKCAEVWVNELRLTGFNEKSGWATTARMRANLADLGSIAISGTHSTPGFGGLEQTVNERQKDYITQFDISTNIELGKFFPEKSGIKIPMHIDYSQLSLRPEYDPMNPDVKLNDMLDTFDRHSKDSILRRSEDLTTRKNINFMNVRKERTFRENKASKPHIWDIENFNISYAYSDMRHSNIDIQYDNMRQHMGGLGYNFTVNPKPIMPFKNVKAFNNNSLKLFREFNFNYIPRSVSFRTDMNRVYNERLMRSKSIGDIKLEPTYLKNWSWNRNYGLQYNPTKAIKMRYSADANAYINEIPGVIDRHNANYQTMVDTIRHELMKFGTMDRYNHQLTATYEVPLNMIPLLNWISVETGYTGKYSWTASPRSIQARLGNSIENSNNIQINSNFRLTNLYNKVGFIKRITQPKPATRRPQPKAIQGEGDGKTAKKDSLSTSIATEIFNAILKNSVRLLTSVKNVNINYNESNGTRLPGYMPQPQILGINLNDMAPGWGFAFGSQRDIRYKAAQNYWLSSDTLLNYPYMTKHNSDFSYRISVEPFPQFRIEINGNQTKSLNHTEYFKADKNKQFTSFNPTENGSFSTSIISLGTAFEKFDKNNFSQAFEEFKNNRIAISKRHAESNPWSSGVQEDGFPDGYSASSQQVLTSAFIAAYTSTSPNKVSLNPFPRIPIPNWRITYTKQNNIEFLKQYLKSVTFTHAYRSSYNVGAYATNLKYMELDGFAYSRNQANDFFSNKEIGMISITEQFNPIIGIDFLLQNSLSTRFQVKRNRNLSLSFVNNQLTEINNKEITVGLGYRIKNVEFLIRSLASSSNQSIRSKSDINLRLDLSFKDNKTILRRIDEEFAQISAGRKATSLNFSADYSFNQKVNLRLYFNKNILNPHVDSQIATSMTEGGFSFTFSLQ